MSINSTTNQPNMNAIRYLIKGAAVVFTAPATIIVASGLYSDPILKILAAAAGLVLVEGVLLLGWQQLDSNKQATEAQRALSASLAIVAYFVLWAVAIAHGEGILGIAFRATLGVALAASIAESGILANVSLRRKVERDISQDRKVRKYRHVAEVHIAKKRIDVWKSNAENALNQPTVIDTPVKMERAILTSPVQPKRKSRGKLDGLDKKLLKYYADDPMLSTRKAAELAGTTHTTVNNRLVKLETAGVIHRNGHGVEIEEFNR